MNKEQVLPTKYWIHPDGFIYIGDQVESAREATEEEIKSHEEYVKNIE
ncbi:hypothetical protein SMC83_004199 [Cronobacter sakazakii]|nr:hypothetical protein [Cronobacter sakazakii]